MTKVCILQFYTTIVALAVYKMLYSTLQSPGCSGCRPVSTPSSPGATRCGRPTPWEPPLLPQKKKDTRTWSRSSWWLPIHTLRLFAKFRWIQELTQLQESFALLLSLLQEEEEKVAPIPIDRAASHTIFFHDACGVYKFYWCILFLFTVDLTSSYGEVIGQGWIYVMTWTAKTAVPMFSIVLADCCIPDCTLRRWYR